jgi:small subunit ribosomal protein S6
MRYYETTYVLSTEISQEGKETLQNRFRGVIQKNGRLIREDDWGKRKLAYQIDHKDYGNYIYMVYEASEPTVHKLELEMNLQADVLRYLSVVIKDATPFLPKEKPAEEAQ